MLNAADKNSQISNPFVAKFHMPLDYDPRPVSKFNEWIRFELEHKFLDDEIQMIVI